MAKSSAEHFTVSSLEAEPGESELTPLELSYLREAGIDPHMLNEMDRDDVIRLLIMHPDRIENPRIGDIAALLYNFGLFREMLEGDVANDSDDDDDDEEKEKERKKRERERRESEKHWFCEEARRMQSREAGSYAEQSTPASVLSTLVSQDKYMANAFPVVLPSIEAVQARMGTAECAAMPDIRQMFDPATLGIRFEGEGEVPERADKTPEMNKADSKDSSTSGDTQLDPAKDDWVSKVTRHEDDQDPHAKTHP